MAKRSLWVAETSLLVAERSLLVAKRSLLVAERSLSVAQRSLWVPEKSLLVAERSLWAEHCLPDPQIPEFQILGLPEAIPDIQISMIQYPTKISNICFFVYGGFFKF